MIFILIFCLLFCGAIGAAIGKTRNNQAVGFFVGLVFGPVGWLLAVFDDKRAKCPECGSRILVGAVRCRHCGVASKTPV